MAELRRDVREVLGDPRAILILDPSAFPESGTESCGVEQWFSIPRRRRIADFADEAALAERLQADIAGWDQGAHPSNPETSVI